MAAQENAAGSAESGGHTAGGTKVTCLIGQVDRPFERSVDIKGDGMLGGKLVEIRSQSCSACQARDFSDGRGSGAAAVVRCGQGADSPIRCVNGIGSAWLPRRLNKGWRFVRAGVGAARKPSAAPVPEVSGVGLALWSGQMAVIHGERGSLSLESSGSPGYDGGLKSDKGGKSFTEAVS